MENMWSSALEVWCLNSYLGVLKLGFTEQQQLTPYLKAFLKLLRLEFWGQYPAVCHYMHLEIKSWILKLTVFHVLLFPYAVARSKLAVMNSVTPHLQNVEDIVVKWKPREKLTFSTHVDSNCLLREGLGVSISGK